MGIRISFNDWVDSTGIDVIAKKLKVHRLTVHYWRSGRNDPSVKYMRQIKKWTKGRVGYDQIIDRPTFTNRFRVGV